MKPNIASALAGRPGAVRSLVAGWVACRVGADQLRSLRSSPDLVRGTSLPASWLKHSDEQTVAGLYAVTQAISEHGLENTDFSQWGVIAAPRFLGRAVLAQALARFAAEGAWGISPHLIPHRSLHAQTGTISQALKIHGPNYGVGGGTDGAGEALISSSALLAGQELPGVWVVLTGFDPELIPSNPLGETECASDSECVAVALALLPPGRQQCGLFLTVAAAGGGCSDMRDQPEFGLEAFADMLHQGDAQAHWKLRCGGWASWEHAQAAAEMTL